MLTAEEELALPALRDYLDRIGFVQIYKFIATASFYHASPNLLNRWSSRRVAGFDAYVTGDCSAYGLLMCLMLEVAVPYDGLTPFEKRVADRLLDARLLAHADGHVAMGPYQLISAEDMPLLVDAGVNYPGETSPRTYLGRDSLLLAFYVGTGHIARHERALDLGTGTGLVGLALGRRCDHVTMTDVSRPALRLAGMNRLLNRMTENVAIRDEGCEDTLRRGDRYTVVTFNPPYMRVPGGLDAPVFARGAGPDGLGYCRTLIERLDDVLLPDGTAYVTANLLGDREGPFFAGKLASHAGAHDLQIDVFVESSTELAAGNAVFQALGAFLHAENPTVSLEECQRRLEELELRTLGATATFLSVMVLRRALGARPSVRVFRRKGGLPIEPAEIRLV